MLEKIVMIINTIIFSEENYYAFFAINNNFLVAKFYLDISGDFFSLIGFFIYLEIIKLKCGGLLYNTKTNIIERGAIELMAVRDNSCSSYSSSESLQENGNDSFRESTNMENNLSTLKNE